MKDMIPPMVHSLCGRVFELVWSVWASSATEALSSSDGSPQTSHWSCPNLIPSPFRLISAAHLSHKCNLKGPGTPLALPCVFDMKITSDSPLLYLCVHSVVLRDLLGNDWQSVVREQVHMYHVYSGKESEIHIRNSSFKFICDFMPHVGCVCESGHLILQARSAVMEAILVLRMWTISHLWPLNYIYCIYLSYMTQKASSVA